MEELQKKPNLVVKTKTFINEVVVELKKSSWPTRKELIDSKDTAKFLESFKLVKGK